VGHTPNEIALSPGGERAYVCNRFSNDISVLDLVKRQEVERIPVSREPSAMTITPDGNALFVANHLPVVTTYEDIVAATVDIIDTKTGELQTKVSLPNGSMALKDVCLSPDGVYAYVTHILARYRLPTTQLDRGWMNTNAVSILDVRRKQLVNTILLDEVDSGAANPWSISCTPDGHYLVITHAGTHEVSVIDRPMLHEKLASQKLEVLAEVPNDFSFMLGMRRRLALGGNGPRGLAILGQTAYVTEYFSDSLSIVDLKPGSTRPVLSVPLSNFVGSTSVRRGELLFHDAQYCFQKWQSCATCHPGEGRVDGLNWDLLNDGIGNPKNTRSMLLAHRTPPSMSTGSRADAERAVRSGIKHIQFSVRPEEEARAIDEYLKSLQPVPSPYLEKEELSESALRGLRVFGRAKCDKCHPAPLFTDLKQYDMGTGRGRDQGVALDTPTLIELWRTAPYLYDGRAATVREVLTGTDESQSHGDVEHLSEQDLRDLIQYLLSL